MSKKEMTKLVEKYLSGECLPDEKLLLEKYLDSYQKKETALFEGNPEEKQCIEERMFCSIIQKIENEEKNRLRKTLFSGKYLKIAASFVLFIVVSLGSFFIIRNYLNKPDVITWNERVTVPGEKAIITLSDSSIIVLNADSKIKYPARFVGANREVFLEGEAYFEVKHDSGKKFMVHSENITTTVLGTKFNVNSYKSEDEIIVSLIEGKVKISDQKEAGSENIIILKPEQCLTYNKKDEISTVDSFDLQKETGWKDNILKFDNEPLDKVLKVLERNFGIKFEIVSKSKAIPKITANFKNESVATILEVIKKLTGFQYKTEKVNNAIVKVKFYKN